ncbi:MAG: hypothetical protein JOZ78_22855 [Chroococcidiopsidaceae cyanobacterium CP_BM_ER_R8_30]|nr:hypothetical protein [Chroococcidiopsidaceae cyanobacterium CP_BM_ER_R8_30]
MSNENLGNRPDSRILDQVLGQARNPTAKAHNNLNPEPLENQSITRANREIRRLYGWLGLLTGFSVLAIGLLAGVVFWSKLQQDRLQQQFSSVTADKAELEHINNNLQSQINNLNSWARLLGQDISSLNQQISRGLPNQVKGIQKDISTIKTSLQKVEATATTRQQISQDLHSTSLHSQNRRGGSSRR